VLVNAMRLLTKHNATHCITPPHNALHGRTLPHPATHCNTLQYATTQGEQEARQALANAMRLLTKHNLKHADVLLNASSIDAGQLKVCVCASICIHTCMYVFMYVYTYTSIYI